MRCPKCSFISFDKVTFCVKCSADVTEIAHALNGTAFKPLGTFFLGTLIPDYAEVFITDQVADDFSFDSDADDLDISMDAVGDFGEVPDLPGDISDDDLSPASEDISEFEGDELSLDGHEVPDMDLSSFGEDTGFKAGPEPVEEASFDDVPEFDLGGVELEEDVDLEMAGEGVDLEEDVDLEMAGEDLDLELDGIATPDFSGIDLSLGDDELEMAGDGDGEIVELGDLEMEVEKEKGNGAAELPDLEL